MKLTNKQVCDILTMLNAFVEQDAIVTASCGYKIYYNIQVLNELYQVYRHELENIHYDDEEEQEKNEELILMAENPKEFNPMFFTLNEFGELKFLMSQIAVLIPLIKIGQN